MGAEKSNTWFDSHKGNHRNSIISAIIESISSPVTKSPQSNPLKLEGGQKYRIDLKYFHCSHNQAYDTGKSKIKLLWGSDKFETKVIENEFLYTENKVPVVKLSGYDNDLFQLSTLKEFESAFTDNKIFKLADLPFEFQNLPCLKSSMNYQLREITFTTTGPIDLFIAVADGRNPLPNDFMDI